MISGSIELNREPFKAKNLLVEQAKAYSQNSMGLVRITCLIGPVKVRAYMLLKVCAKIKN